MRVPPGNGPGGFARPNGGATKRRNGANGNGLGAAYANHRRRDRLRRRRERRARRRVFVVAVLVAILGLLAALAGTAFTGASALLSNCDLESLRPVAIGQNSFVYAADGSLLGAIPAEKNRQPRKLGEMSPWLAKATVAVEDRRFYEHSGVDVHGITRALVENLSSGRIVQGGSTITQQLVRNLYIGNERSFARKAKEACLARKLESQGLPVWPTPPAGPPESRKAWMKARVLETYLNQVYFGNHAYGVEAAAQTYFSKPASELNLAQAALLAGLPQAPSVYDPFARETEAVRRRNEVLRAMLVAGDIGQARYDKAVQTRLRLKPGSLYTEIREPYFFSFVRDQLIRKYGVSMVRSGGLRVYTTIDPRFQRLAADAIKTTLNEKTDPASAIVAINPVNGAIRAMTAVTPQRRKLQFNLAAQGRRQAGSSFKTFVLTEAIKEGINPDSTLYLSAPFTWQPDPLSEPWPVKTYDDSYYGVSTITQATLRSDNTVYARLTLDVGPENVVRTARSMGITTKLEPVASVGLGSNSVSVLEMASAYATLAAGGVYSEPMAIREVVLASGKVDDQAGWGAPRRRRVLDQAVAYEVTQLLEQNMLAGTGTGAYFGRPAAGKTGTTDRFADAWFCGYTPNLAAAVWVGYPNAQIEMDDVHGIRVAGGTFPATIWNLFVSAALAPTPPLDWIVPPDSVEWQPFDGQYEYKGPPPGSEPPKKKKDKGKKDKPTTGETATGATTTAPSTGTSTQPATTGGGGGTTTGTG